jgi:hypothetical protein
MDVSPALVADLQAPEAVEPGEHPFVHPPVASQAVLGPGFESANLYYANLPASLTFACARVACGMCQ